MEETNVTPEQFIENHPELKDKEVVLCEHLRSGASSYVSINLWIGDNMRLLLCPICEKVHAQTVINAYIKVCKFIIDVTQKVEYDEWIKSSGEGK